MYDSQPKFTKGTEARDNCEVTELESVHLLQQSVNRLARCKEQLSMIEDKLSGTMPGEVSEPSNVENLKMLRDMLNEFGAVLALLRIEIDA
jgi:hypothetical protein